MKIYEIKEVEMFEHLIETDNQVVTHLSLKAGSDVPEHDSDFTAIVIPIKGRIEFSASEEKEIIYPGKIVQMVPNEMHYLKALDDSDFIVVKSDLK